MRNGDWPDRSVNSPASAIGCVTQMHNRSRTIASMSTAVCGPKPDAARGSATRLPQCPREERQYSSSPIARGGADARQHDRLAVEYAAYRECITASRDRCSPTMSRIWERRRAASAGPQPELERGRVPAVGRPALPDGATRAVKCQRRDLGVTRSQNAQWCCSAIVLSGVRTLSPAGASVMTIRGRLTNFVHSGVCGAVGLPRRAYPMT